MKEKIRKIFSSKERTFRRKIEMSFFALSAVSTFAIVFTLFNLIRLSNNHSETTSQYVIPSEKLNEIYQAFQNQQFNLMKFSIPEFKDQFQTSIRSVQISRKIIDSLVTEFKSIALDKNIKQYSDEIEKTFKEYNNLVVDATLSAAAMQDFEMASAISATSGEEVGNKLKVSIQNIFDYLSVKKNGLDKSTNDILTQSIYFVAVMVIFGTLLFMYTFLRTIPSLVKPVGIMVRSIDRFALGDFEEKVDYNQKDEFGQIAQGLNKLREATLEKIKAADKIAEGDLEVEINELSEKDCLSKSFNKMKDNISYLIKEGQKLTQALAEGKSSTRANAEGLMGAYKEILSGFNTALDEIYLPLSDAMDVLRKISAGDLTVRLTKDYKGDHQLIKTSINQVTDSLSTAIIQVTEAVESTASAANQILSSTEEMASGAQEQSQQTAEVANSVEEMAKTIIETTRNTVAAAEASKGAGEVAREGGIVVLETIEGMNRIADVVKRSADTVTQLGKNSDQIGEIIQVIEDIADQTNLLALNAAIEAARAGEQGRGFAVVADEVRKLAERTTKATKEIASMIKQIQKDTKWAVEAMNEGKTEVEKGREKAEQAGRSLEKIIVESERVVDIISQVAAASEQQSSASEQISKSLESISNVTHQSAAGIQQIARAAEELNNLTLNLQNLVSAFKIERVEEFNKRQGRAARGREEKGEMFVKHNGTFHFK
ncbi:methyl-accepting chemotaxis protein [Ignavibacterium album]|uniref:HAMP domain-containing methyl-accepting chemotaxis protein n=1 Tax=Ignavibacterium album TaxID=591197 RepID=UPI0026E94BDC|nr:methyl-accepting chemotaxis protein [Ignavibacterium album]